MPAPAYFPSFAEGDGREATTVAGLLLDLLQRGRPRWHGDALCQEYPAVEFFSAPADEGPAKAVCGRCLVRAECLSWSLGQGVNLHGVWGGLRADERRARRRRHVA